MPVRRAFTSRACLGEGLSEVGGPIEGPFTGGLKCRIPI